MRSVEQQWDETFVDVILAGGRSDCFLVLVREMKMFISWMCIGLL